MTAGIIWLCAGALFAQTAIPPTDDIDKDRKKEKVSLSPEAAELGQEYFEILQELRELTSDYAEYLAAIKSQRVVRQEAELKRLSERLARGQYLRSISDLSIDLKKLKAELEAQADSLHGENRKAYFLTRDLSLNLGAVQASLQAAVANRQKAEQELSQQLQLVVEHSNHGISIDADKLRKLCMQIQCSDSMINIVLPDFQTSFAHVFDSGYVFWTDSGKSGDVWVNIDVDEPRAPKAPKPPKSMASVPDVPDVPAVTGSRNFVYTGPRGATRVIKEFTDSILVSSSRAVIVVTNPIGDVHLAGWDRRFISVKSQVTVSADVQQKAAELAGKVGVVLRQSADRDTFFVECTVPNLHDPAVNIDNDVIEVHLPRSNPLLASTSFGNVTVSSLHGDVALSASHGTVAIQDVRGNVTFSGDISEVSVDNVQGNLTMSNNQGPISIAESAGSMTLKNRYSSVTLEDCEGSVVIDNTGPVEITSHVGSAQVRNRNGTVEILHSEGDYVVDNSIQPVTVEYIDGSVELGNVRGPIRVSDVSGSAKAQNQYGSIEASYLSGPVELTNTRGTTLLMLNKDLSGPSVINSDYGVIRLTLSPDTDVLVKAKTDGGTIESAWPVSVSTAGSVKSTELKIGRGKNELTLSGDRATIILSDSK